MIFFLFQRQFQVQNINEIKSPKTKTYHILDLLKTPNLRRNTLLITFIWFENIEMNIRKNSPFFYGFPLSGSQTPQST